MPERRSVEERFCQRQSCSTAPIRPQQLRRLQALWHRWTGQLELSPAADQALRHYYVRLFSQGRADQTLELTASDAEVVIQRLAKLIRWSEIKTDYAAGTAGRRGYREWRRVPPNQSAWNALWGCASALGMEPADLDNFIRRHYASTGLEGVTDLRTMADLNRVLWGLKAILRRRNRNSLSSCNRVRAA